MLNGDDYRNSVMDLFKITGYQNFKKNNKKILRWWHVIQNYVNGKQSIQEMWRS